MIFKDFVKNTELLASVYYLEMTQIDEKLIAKIQTGDDAALDELITRWHPRVQRLVQKKFAWDQDSVEDISQETMMKAIQFLKSGREVRNFPVWIMRIARNVAITMSRKRVDPVDDPEELRLTQGDKRTGPAGVDVVMDKDDPTAKGVEDSEAIQAMMQSLDKIKDYHADALRRRYFQHQGEEESAAELNVPRGTVKRRIHNAKKELGNIMRKQGFGD